MPLPAPPLDSDGDRSDDSIDSTSLFGPWSSSDDEQRGSKLPKDEWSDEDLDISLATLTHEAVHDGKKPKGATAGDEDWDWLSEFDGLGDDELFADGGMPVFHVYKEGDQVDDSGSDASGDLDDLWASEGEADEQPPAKKRLAARRTVLTNSRRIADALAAVPDRLTMRTGANCNQQVAYVACTGSLVRCRTGMANCHQVCMTPRAAIADRGDSTRDSAQRRQLWQM